MRKIKINRMDKQITLQLTYSSLKTKKLKLIIAVAGFPVIYDVSLFAYRDINKKGARHYL